MAVQPVWWEAPRPAPVSPLKYSLKVGWACHSGPVGRWTGSPGRRPSGMSSPRALLDKLLVRVGRLRMAAEVLGIRVCRGGVEVPPELLGVLTVVPLAVRQPEQALLQTVIVTVPERGGQVQETETVTQAGNPVLAPAVGAAVRVVEREERPGVPVGRVVLPDGAPLPPRQVGSPQPPGCEVIGGRGQPLMLGRLARTRLHLLGSLLPAGRAANRPAHRVTKGFHSRTYSSMSRCGPVVLWRGAGRTHDWTKADATCRRGDCGLAAGRIDRLAGRLFDPR